MRSDYPVQMVVGSCFSTYTVQWKCESNPTDVFIRDDRRAPLFLTPRSNTITVTATEF
jgi:hypothetical protein